MAGHSQRRNQEKAAQIAAEFMTAFYHGQIGALETQEFRNSWFRSGLCPSPTRSKDHYGNYFFVVVLPDGRVVEPRVTKRL
jgi:hypothetical protein